MALAIEAGSKFIVSPGFSEEVADCCKERGLLYLPGIVTPYFLRLQYRKYKILQKL